jgi:hypothetical protein
MKTRKSLISKNKKETLLSKINLTALKVLWLLGYGLLFSCLVIAVTRPFYSNFSFYREHWADTAIAITVDNTIYINLEAASSSLSISADLPAIFSQLTAQHKGLHNDHSDMQFNLNIYTNSLTTSAQTYISLYF